MSSQVNPNSINPAYPVAGVNQSTQGFRSNFLAIQQNFAQYVTEMNDLISKAIVSAPLIYGSNVSVNNFGGIQNANLSLYDFGLFSANANSISSSTTLNVDMSQAAFYPYTLTGTNTTQSVGISNFPNLGYSEVVIEVTPTTVPQFLDLSSVVAGGKVYTSGNAAIAGYNSTTSNLALTKSQAPYLVKLGSVDGSNWILSTTSSGAVARNGAPGSAIGAFGDTTGMIAFDATHIWVCTGNYDGATSIWKSAAIS